MPTPESIDPVLAALDQLEAALGQTAERNRIALRRAGAIRRLRKRGVPYSEIVPIEERPLVVELLTQTLGDLSEAGSNFRRVEARALYSEGLTMAEIAKLFGVTRQRIATLLHPGNTSRKQSRERNGLRDLSIVWVLACKFGLEFPVL